MKLIHGVAIIAVLALSGCSAVPTWDEFSKASQPERLCSRSQKSDECQIEKMAFQRANQLCQHDSDPSYCFTMAKYGWDNKKYLLAQTGEPLTEETVKEFTVLCGLKQNAPFPC
ncbi:hypothetical protein M1D72_03330 [Vibrio sp. AK197]